MSAAAVPMPDTMGQPPDRGAQQDAASMVGSSPSPLPDKQKQTQAFMNRIREFHTGLDDFARQFPAFSKYAQKAQDALIEGMTEVTSKMSSPEQSAPQLVG